MICKHDSKTLARFWDKVNKSSSENCWGWEAQLVRGYGKFWFNGANWRAHRFSWLIDNGNIPSGACILHRCDNPKCVNPKHLFLGSHADNMRDKMNKGRACKKITLPEAFEIRERYATGGVLQRELAAEFGVDITSISYIVNHATS